MTFKEYFKMKKDAHGKKADAGDETQQADVSADARSSSGNVSDDAQDLDDGNTSKSNTGACQEQTVFVEEEKQPSEEEKLRDRLLRLQADFDNYRKRVARDHSEMVKRANEDLVESLLPVLDHMAHAEEMMAKDSRNDVSSYLDGFKLVKNELIRVLDGFGVKAMDMVGKPFDANIHEALSSMQSDTAKPGTVLVELRKGYTLYGRTLRAAQVIVAAEKQEPETAGESSPAETETETAGV